MELWVGPAIVAAVVSGLINALGWFVTFRQSRRLDELRRDEKVHDFQVALRAEIASDLLTMAIVDRDAYLAQIRQRYADDPGYSVLVPHLSRNVVFDVIVKEIHVLPGAVIDVVVNYARLRQILERFIDDMRDAQFRELSAERQLTMYADYLGMQGRLEGLARSAFAALDNSLNSPGGDRPTQAAALAARESGPESVGKDVP